MSQETLIIIVLIGDSPHRIPNPLHADRPPRAFRTNQGGVMPPLAEAATSLNRLFRQHESPETAVSGA
jgi:hypothetical protein